MATLQLTAKPRPLFQQPLPEEIRALSAEETDARIARARETLGDRVVILGHHYQRDEIIKHADFRGDSFKLSQLAAERKDADYIVFCGVHFMAESADILSADHQKVILPNLNAGCSMADMADIYQVDECWENLQELGIAEDVVPITYMNSAANLKAFVGRNGGAVCTSSNARAVLEWAFQQKPKVLFFPDQHLGRNTGYRMGIPLEQMIVWDPREELGGNEPETLQDSKILLWKGHCSVHGRFTVDQIKEARESYPGIHVMVHPECPLDVVLASDYDGSTEYIIKKVNEAAPGSKWAIGTEINLVNRLAQEHPDKTIFCLDPVICPCSTMYRIHPHFLLWTLENLLDGKVVNEIKVHPEVADQAKVALNRMLAIT
ncbi:MAG: quinolinate synthase NadA [Armatimonadetes bacterium]|nr:quinolinate synthase NadA [Armatimonadota bacterium]